MEKVVNYGAESFAVCKLGEKTVNVSVPDGFAETEVKLSLNADELAIIEVTRSIRLA